MSFEESNGALVGERSSAIYASQIVRGETDDGFSPYVPGINCFECGRFVGRDGYIGIEHFEMSDVVASVEGQCRRCLDRDRECNPQRYS